MLKHVKIWEDQTTPSLAVREDMTTIWLDHADPSYGTSRTARFKMWHAPTRAYSTHPTFAGAEANIERLDEYPGK